MLRDLLLKRVRPLVEQLAEDIAGIAVARIEAELARLPEAMEIALSAYAGDAPDTFTRVLDVVRALPVNHAADAEAERALAQHAATRTKRKLEASPVARRDIKPENILPGLDAGIAAMKTAVDAMLGPPNHRPPPPDVTTSGKPRQRAVMRCRTCGKLGGRADGCGTSHQPEKPLTTSAPARRLKPTPAALEAASVRIKERIASIAASASRVVAAPKRKAMQDENPSVEERWTPRQIAEETEIEENRKHDGELPRPRSSFEVTPRNSGELGYGADLGDVEELNFG